MNKIDIFYADDDEDDVMFFNEAIDEIATQSKNQIKLHVHLNGENLIENLKSNKNSNSVVFLDINMPLKSGFDILEEIRNEPQIKSLPIIIFSTSSSQNNISKSQNLGADFYAIKPSKYSNLMTMISKVIQVNWDSHQYNVSNFLSLNSNY